MAANLKEWIYDVVVNRKAKSKIDYNAQDPELGARAVVHDKVHQIPIFITPSAVRAFEKKSNGKKLAALKTYFVTLKNFVVRVSPMASDVYLEVDHLSVITDAGGSLIGHPRNISQDRTVRELLRSMKGLPPSDYQLKSLSELSRAVADRANEPQGSRPLKELTNEELIPPFAQMQFILHNNHWPLPPDFDVEDRIASFKQSTPSSSSLSELSINSSAQSREEALTNLEVSVLASQPSPNSSLPFAVRVIEDEGKEKGVRMPRESQFALIDSESDGSSPDLLRLSDILEEKAEKTTSVSHFEELPQQLTAPGSLLNENPPDIFTVESPAIYRGDSTYGHGSRAEAAAHQEHTLAADDGLTEPLLSAMSAQTSSNVPMPQTISIGPTPPAPIQYPSPAVTPVVPASSEISEVQHPLHSQEFASASSEDGPGILTQMLNAEPVLQQQISSPIRVSLPLHQTPATSPPKSVGRGRLLRQAPVKDSQGEDALDALVDMVIASPSATSSQHLHSQHRDETAPSVKHVLNVQEMSAESARASLRSRTREIAQVVADQRERGQNVAILLSKIPDSDEESSESNSEDNWQAAFLSNFNSPTRVGAALTPEVDELFEFFAPPPRSAFQHAPPHSPSSLSSLSSASLSSSLFQRSRTKSPITLVPETPPRPIPPRPLAEVTPPKKEFSSPSLAEKDTCKSPDITKSSSLMSTWLSKAIVGSDKRASHSSDKRAVEMPHEPHSVISNATEIEIADLRLVDRRSKKRAHDATAFVEAEGVGTKKARPKKTSKSKASSVEEKSSQDETGNTWKEEKSKNSTISTAGRIAVTQQRDPAAYSRWLALANPRK